MFAFPGMLLSAAKKAGMDTPDDPEKYEEYRELYPHFYCFCVMQLGQPMPYPGVHFDNAKVIAEINEDDLKKMSMNDFLKAGFKIGYSKGFGGQK